MSKPQQDEPTVAEMRAAVESKQINLNDTALRGKDFDGLMKLLYRNFDIMATSLQDLPGSDIIKLRIETTGPPIHKRAYKHSPSAKLEISRQTKEMLDAYIIEIFFSVVEPGFTCEEKNMELKDFVLISVI